MKKRVKAKVGKSGFLVCLYEFEKTLENNEVVKDFRVLVDNMKLNQGLLDIKSVNELEAVLELLGLVRTFIPDNRKFNEYKSSIDNVVSVDLDNEKSKYRQYKNIKYARNWLLSNYVDALNIYNRYIPCKLEYV